MTTVEPRDVEVERSCERFLFHEAELLDDDRVHDWFERIAEDTEGPAPGPRRERERRGMSAGDRVADQHGSLTWQTPETLSRLLEDPMGPAGA